MGHPNAGRIESFYASIEMNFMSCNDNSIKSLPQKKQLEILCSFQSILLQLLNHILFFGNAPGRENENYLDEYIFIHLDDFHSFGS